MRREQKKNKILIILILLSGFCTILSFIFDQQVIQSENKIREIEGNLNEKRIEIKNLQSTINRINELSFNIVSSLNNFRDNFDFFYIYNDNINLQLYGKKEDKSYFFENINKEDLLELKSKFRKNIILSHQSYDNKVDEIHIINNQIRSNPSVIEILSKNQGYPMVRKDLREYKIKDTFNNFPYDSFFSDEDLQTEKTFQSSEADKIYSATRQKMQDLDNIEFEYSDLVYRLEVKYQNSFSFFSDTLEYYGENKNNKNLFILLSIFFQILALTFLMFLFKIMIKKQ